MDKETAEKLIRYVTKNLERESGWLTPDPTVIMHEPYGLLDLIREESGLTGDEVDKIMQNAQRSR